MDVPSFVPNKSATTIEALCLLADLTGDDALLHRVVRPCADAILTLQVPPEGGPLAGAIAQNVGDADKALPGAATKVEAIYEVPFLAHATMEPMNCTVHMRKDACEIWVGNQALAREAAELMPLLLCLLFAASRRRSSQHRIPTFASKSGFR